MFFLVFFISVFSYATEPAKSKEQLCMENPISSDIDESNKFEFCTQFVKLQDNLDGNCTNELKAWMKTPETETDKKKTTYDNLSQCKEEWNEKLNTEYGKGDCKEQVKKKYETAEKWEEEDKKTPKDEEKVKERKEEAKEAEKKLKTCKETKGYTKDNEDCSDAAKDLKDVRQDFNDNCGELGGDADSCIRSLKSCSECDNPSGDISAEDVDCVMIRQTGICPELATGFVEDLKEEKEDFEDKIKDLEEKLETLKEDRSKLDAELSDEKLAFEADIEELKTTEEELKEEMELNLKNIKGETKAAFQTARAKVLAEMDKADHLQYQLSNDIEEAHRKYRDGKKTVYRDCKIQAAEKLSEFRKARKAAIHQGRFRKESISQALSENRVTFSQKDDARFSRYYNTCIKQNKYIVDSLKEDLHFALKKIEQQKQMIIRQLESMKSQMQALANEASAKDQTVVQDYLTQMGKITEKFTKQVNSRTNVYIQKSAQLGKQITEKTMEIMQIEGILRETQYKFNHNQEMRNRLRSAGASDEDKSSQLAEASSSHNNLIEEWDSVFQICNCEPGDFKKDEEAKECKQIKRAGKLVEPDHESLQNPSSSRRSGTSGSGSDTVDE